MGSDYESLLSVKSTTECSKFLTQGGYWTIDFLNNKQQENLLTEK